MNKGRTFIHKLKIAIDDLLMADVGSEQRVGTNSMAAPPEMLPVGQCENIPTWISLCLTTVFSQQGGISVFKFTKRFSEISWSKISLYWIYCLFFRS